MARPARPAARAKSPLTPAASQAAARGGGKGGKAGGKDGKARVKGGKAAASAVRPWTTAARPGAAGSSFRRRGRQRPAARAATAGGASGNGRWRRLFAFCLCTEVVRVNTQVPAWLIPQQWRWTAATPTARRAWLTPLWVTDPMSIGPPTRRCCASFSSAAFTTRTMARSRWSLRSR